MKNIKEQIEVMQHFAAGGKIEVRCHHGNWASTTCPLWDWHTTDYRSVVPAPSPIAKGHNPANLTEEQVGVKEGWRLLSREEISHVMATRSGTVLSLWIMCDKWKDESSCAGLMACIYRTKQYEGFFLPTRRALTSRDFAAKPVIWVRQCPNNQYMVVALEQNNMDTDIVWVIVTSSLGATRRYSFEELKDNKWEYSTDRLHWKPCYIEE